MSLIEQIDQALKQALKGGEEIKISTLRLLKSSLHNAEIAQRKALSEEESYQVIKREINQRKEAAEEYRKAGRADLQTKEEKELEILRDYLPAQLSDAEIQEGVRKAISKLKAGPADFERSKKQGSRAEARGSYFGQVMKEVISKIKGRADGSRVAEIVKRELNG